VSVTEPLLAVLLAAFGGMAGSGAGTPPRCQPGDIDCRSIEMAA
jgi:hypothetical protein